MGKQVDPKISKYMSDLAKQRKNPYLPFTNPEYAKEMSAKAAVKRRENANQKGKLDDAQKKSG